MAQSSAPRPLAVDVTPFEISGEEVTTLVQSAHAATQSAKLRLEASPGETAITAAAKAEEPRATEQSRKAEPKKRVVHQEHKPPAKVAMPKPSPRPIETAALVAPQLPPPPPVAITPEPAQEKRSWFGRTWDTVSGWSGDAAHAVVATPGAVARAGKRTFEVVSDAVVPGR
jgi:hypothetical protein